MSRVFLLALLIAALSAPAFAGEPATTTEAGPAKADAGSLPATEILPVDPARAEVIRIERQQRLALNREIAARIAKAKEDVQALEAQSLETADPSLKLAIQKQISTVKKESRIDLLRIQLRHAQAAGRTGQVKEISTAIEKMTHPQIERLAVPAVRVQRQNAQEAGQ